MNTQKNHLAKFKTQLRIEGLERREMMAGDFEIAHAQAAALSEHQGQPTPVQAIVAADTAHLVLTSNSPVCFVGPVDALQSTSASFDENTGVLTISGGQEAETVRVFDHGQGQIRVSISGSGGRADFDFDRSAVKSIIYDGKGGDDAFYNYTDKRVIASGGAGNDIISGGTSADRIDGGDGDDQLFGGIGDDELLGGSGNDQLFGETGNDVLVGSGGHDELHGGDGDDLLLGEIGDDHLVGGLGIDQLEGGSGENHVEDEDAQSPVDILPEYWNLDPGFSRMLPEAWNIDPGSPIRLPYTENLDPRFSRMLPEAWINDSGSISTVLPGWISDYEFGQAVHLPASLVGEAPAMAEDTSVSEQDVFAELNRLSTEELAIRLRQLFGGPLTFDIPDETVEDFISNELNDSVSGTIVKTATERTSVSNFSAKLVNGGVEISFDYTHEQRGYTIVFGKRHYTRWISDSGEMTARISVSMLDGTVTAIARNGNVEWTSDNAIVRFFAGEFDLKVRDSVTNAINEGLKEALGDGKKSIADLLIENQAAKALSELAPISEAQAAALIRKVGPAISGQITSDGVSFKLEVTSPVAWQGTTAMTTFNGSAYIIKDSSLWVVEPKSGTTTQIGKTGAWSGETLMTAHGDRLYVIQDDTLWRVNPSNGGFTKVGKSDTWGGATSMTTVGDSLYVIENNTLWQINPSDGSYKRLGKSGAWSGETLMTTHGDRLYVIQDDTLWRVNPADGKFTKVGKSDAWSGATSMTTMGDSLYVIENNTLWRVNPSDGSYKRLGNPGAWSGETLMTSHGDRLYVIQDDTLWRVDPTNGSFKKVHTVTSDPIEPQAARLVSIESTRLAATTGANASSASVGDSNGTTSTVTWVNPIIAPAPVRTTEQTQAGTASANQVTGSAAVSNITRTAESLGSERRMKETLHRAALDAVLANVDGLLYTGPFKDAIDVLSRSAGPGNGRIHG